MYKKMFYEITLKKKYIKKIKKIINKKERNSTLNYKKTKQNKTKTNLFALSIFFETSSF
jgi:hypothetical protein